MHYLYCRRAVLQSGAINAPWSNLTPEKSRKISQQLINDCGCQVKPRMIYENLYEID
jgi:hypothetical protein